MRGESLQNRSTSRPRVSIGLPVYNGERYLHDTLQSLLAQTYRDFELIITDNASTDATPEICGKFAERDSRVRYFRNRKNLGASANYNRAFGVSHGEYFKWAAHDDLCEPRYLETCVELLDQNPRAVVAHCKTGIIDEHGHQVREYDDFLDLRSPSPRERLRVYFWRPAAEWNAIFGLIRSDVLRGTPLIGKFIASDQVLLGELTMKGLVLQAPQHLFFRRDHSENSWRAHQTTDELHAWYDPTPRNGFRSPLVFRHFLEYRRAIGRSRLRLSERAWCHLYVHRWFAQQVVRKIRHKWQSRQRIADRSSAAST